VMMSDVCTRGASAVLYGGTFREDWSGGRAARDAARVLDVGGGHRVRNAAVVEI
jgi:hypothetical protein